MLWRVVILLWLMALAPACAEEVDVQLVLAVDVSLSMDDAEQRLQREAYVSALRDPAIVQVIGSGPTGRIALAVFEWSSEGEQRLLLPWTVIGSQAQAEAAAATIEREPISRMRRTSISDAMLYAERLFQQAGHTAPRRVLDISGDGSNNEGPPVAETRDRLVAQGIIINGLPLVLDRVGTQMPFPWSLLPQADAQPVTLEDYYDQCVRGGPGSFVVPVREIGELAGALRVKMILEIAGVVSQVIPVQAGPALDCAGRFSF